MYINKNMRLTKHYDPLQNVAVKNKLAQKPTTSVSTDWFRLAKIGNLRHWHALLNPLIYYISVRIQNMTSITFYSIVINYVSTSMAMDTHHDKLLIHRSEREKHPYLENG